MKQIDLKAYAKINLAIDVVRKLPSGYHELSMVMQQVGLYDNICVRWLPKQADKKETKITIQVNSNKKFLPKDERNLAYKAAKVMIERFNIYERFGSGKVRIDIKKQIPVGAGLGGGSADSAAVLRALSKIWGLGLKAQELCDLGAALGADVPFCIMGQEGEPAALAEGIGTELTPIQGLDTWIVLSKPSISVSTAEVYKGFSLIEDKNFERPNTKQLISDIRENNFALIEKNIINVLENFVLKVYPSIVYTKNKLINETSPMKAVMSGSGPTIIGFYENKQNAEDAYEKMRLINKETFLTKTLANNDLRGKDYAEF